VVRVDAVLVVVVGLGAALLDVAAGTEVVAVRAVAVPVDVVGTVPVAVVAVVAVAVADGVVEAVAVVTVVAVVAVELVLLDGGLVVRTCTMSSAAEHAASTDVSAAAPTTTAPHRPRARRRPIAALPEALHRR
jgi:hypothetical protein